MINIKKILLLFISLFLCLSNVEAKVYYSKYGDYSNYSLEEYEKSDTLSVDKLITKHYYYEEVTFSDEYFIEGENDLEFPFISNDFIEFESELLEEKPDSKINRTIDKITKYYVSDLLKVRYIKIKNYENLSLIKFKNIKEEINYDTLSEDDEIVIDLKEEYELDNLRFYIYGDKFDVDILRELDGKVYYTGNFLNKKYYFNVKELRIKNPEYGEYYYLDSIDNLKTTTRVSNKTFYKYIDKLFKYYKKDIFYNPEFFYTELYNLEGPEITLYRYKTRDKVEVLDDIVITDEFDIKLDDIVVNSTVEYKIFSNLDTAVNGDYKATIITPFKEIVVPIKVDKKSNIMNMLIKQIELNNNLKKTNNELTSTVNKQYTEIKEIINRTNETINDLNNEVLEKEIIIKECENDKKDFDEEVTSTKKLNLQLFIPLWFLILILISVYFYFKMSNTNNS